MITIKMREGKWRILLGDEIWQFENINDFKNCLETLIILKDKFGRIK
jgi:hypothetical protein